jgi:hypothetical protein
MMPDAKVPHEAYGTDEIESIGPGDYSELIFYLYDRQDRISERLNKKIANLDRRLKQIEERGHS